MAEKIYGDSTFAVCYATEIDGDARTQIRRICSHPCLEGSPVRIMPDTHAGKSSVVGLTVPVDRDRGIIPALIGTDIGCGMLCVRLDAEGDIDFAALDAAVREACSSGADNAELEEAMGLLLRRKCGRLAKNGLGMGSLGGGNHFVELDASREGFRHLVIHTGSRRFGVAVHGYHQDVAARSHPCRLSDLPYLTGPDADAYLSDIAMAVRFARANRRAIADGVMRRMGWRETDSFDTPHNMISDDGILRKGAIRADGGVRVIIPLNMRDGSVIAVGRGNPEWNCSAPHGAGRLFSRSEAKELVTLEEYRRSMEGVWSSCVVGSKVDESPLAYRDPGAIVGAIGDAVTVLETVRPLYNFKA